jgi:hypothetical protein
MSADRIAQYKTIAIVASCLGLFTACGIGYRNSAPPPPPPPEPSSSEIDLSPNPLEFAPTVVGSVSATQTLTITNHGQIPITFTAAIVGGYPTSFLVQHETCTAAPLAPEDQCAITVAFRPKVAKPAVGDLYIHSQRPVPFTVRLLGTGLATKPPPSTEPPWPIP